MQCGACTYENKPGSLQCSICSTPLQSLEEPVDIVVDEEEVPKESTRLFCDLDRLFIGAVDRALQDLYDRVNKKQITSKEDLDMQLLIAESCIHGSVNGSISHIYVEEALSYVRNTMFARLQSYFALHRRLVTDSIGTGLEEKVFPFWDEDMDYQGAPYKTVSIDPTTAEYEWMLALFKGSGYNNLKVDRIQNHELLRNYQLFKRTIPDKTEAFLFHGTSDSSVDSICASNIDPRMNGKNGVMYGFGAYFARKYTTSLKFCTGRKKIMFLAKVLIGRWKTVGKAGMKKPPSGFDTVCDKVQNPQMHVVFDRHQIIPIYRIELL